MAVAYRRFKIVLCIAAAVMTLGTTALAACICLGPLPVVTGVAPNLGKRVLTAQPESSGNKLQLADFADVSNSRLQRPLEDPAKPKLVNKPAPTPAPPPKVDAVLLGTAVESDPTKSMAWIRFASENASLKIRVGDTLETSGRPSVKQIFEGAVLLDFQGRDLTLHMRTKD